MSTIVHKAPDQDKGAPGAAAAAVEAAESEESTAAQTASAEPSSLERMARLRQLVRKDGMDAETAAKEVGVDPIIAQLWLRLPDDLWPAPRTAGSASGAHGNGPVLPPSAPTSGLRRVLTARIPSPAYDRLRVGETPLLEGALNALQTGLALAVPEVAPGGWRFARRPLALPVPSADYTAVLRLAQEHFDSDPREAAGWLIARGMGMALPLPTKEELAGLPALRQAASAPAQPLPAPRFVVPPRRRPEPRAPLPADDSAPNGDELRSRREAVGISQRDLAAASGLSRGLVAEVERGRRRHVLTRLKLAETLASIAKQSGKQLATA
jgi:DNA-binding XRE family transcriptional regulator